MDGKLITNTINQILVNHQASGFSSDVAWSLAFCLEQRCTLNGRAGRILSEFDDDCTALQALHMHREGLLPTGFGTNRISKVLRKADLDREHWLIAYETVRHGFLPICAAAVGANPLFSELLRNRVTFYRRKLPVYSSVIHPGGAPEWVVRSWIASLAGLEPAKAGRGPEKSRVTDMIGEDLAKLDPAPGTVDDAIIDLMDAFAPIEPMPVEEVEEGGVDEYAM